MIKAIIACLLCTQIGMISGMDDAPRVHVISWHQESERYDGIDLSIKPPRFMIVDTIRRDIAKAYPHFTHMDFVTVALHSLHDAHLLKLETATDVKKKFGTSLIRIIHEPSKSYLNIELLESNEQ